MNKIKIALVFYDKSTAEKFVYKNAPGGVTKINSKYKFVYETPLLYFMWFKPFTNVWGERLNFVFTTEDVRDTYWFDTVIRPMQMVGTGVIDQKHKIK